MVQQGQVSGAEKQHLADLESLICATLQSLVRKVRRDDVVAISSSVMEALLLMFQTSSAGASSGVLEDALMTVGVLVEGETRGRGGGGALVATCPSLLVPRVMHNSAFT